tara:strand:+ start:1162 stop:2508 length:1347 start_codon:yes stop_codon:yes gene_type:complete
VTKTKKNKFLIDKYDHKFSVNDQYGSNSEKNKFIEIASSLAYYLKLFSSLKRFLEYIALVAKHILNQDFSIVIPLDEKGQIWLENIYLSGDYKFNNIILEIKEFCNNSNLLNNFKIKDSHILEEYFQNIFPSCVFKCHKLNSRNKCRGFFYVFYKKTRELDISCDERNISFLLNILAVGIENYLLLKVNKKHENVDREISSGAEIQSRLLPDFCPKIFGVELAAHCRPALQLGGDYYDFMSIKPNIEEKRRQKGRWALVIGDVMGKGIPAGLLMTMLRGMLRAEVLTGLPPDRILHDLNQLAIYDLDQSHRFITLFYSDFDPRTKKLRYANAAHNPPLLWQNANQKIKKLDADGFVIGLQKDAEYQCGEVKLSSSDLILYYTDGITEASNSNGERFGEKNLINTFSKLCKKSLNSQQILDEIFKTLDKFAGKKRDLDDDASIVIFKLE